MTSYDVTELPSETVDAMIDLRQYKHNDAIELSRRLHPISKAELGDAWLPEVCDLAARVGTLTTGRINGRIAFVAGSAPIEDMPGQRATVFLFAEGFDSLIAFGLRRWAEAEKERHPNTVFVSISEGDHPLKHRFLAVAGCQHVEGNRFVALAD